MSTDGLEMCLGVACEFPEEGVDVFKTPSQISAASPVEEEQSSLEIFIHVLASMQATRPEIVRGIPVCRALQLAPLLWARGDLDALHRCSKATPKLTEFWSHSWQTKAWLKYISILFLNNSFPAFVVGTVLASVSFALWVADILPTWSRRHQYGWSLVTGVVSYYLTLLFWRSRKLAFLDIACINQTDKVRKTEGLVSMGAILKNSDQLLVLWDATYAARLWCMFEMAAFLHAKGPAEDAQRYLIVCPVFVGPALLIGNLALSILLLGFQFTKLPLFWEGLAMMCALFFPCFTLLAYVVLEHCRSIEAVQKQVSCFALEDASCFCCSRDHTNPATGEPMICDRSILVRCISSWFGSTKQFESVVRHHVLTALVHQLARHVFSYWRIVQALCPVLWLFLDMMISMVPVAGCLRAIAYCMLLLPSLVLILLHLAYKQRNLAHGMCQQLMLSIGLVATGGLMFAISTAAEGVITELSRRLFGTPVPGNSAVLILFGVVTVLLWRYSPMIDMQTASPGMQ